MNSSEQYPFSALEVASRVPFDVLQSRMMTKFSLDLFIPDTVPHFVLEDLYKLGAVTQPVTGGSHLSWCEKAKAVAEIRATYGKPSPLETIKA